MNIIRIYHPYHLWEEVAAGMWADVENAKEHLDRAVAFTGNHELYGLFMMRVAAEWRYSCENALTDAMLNKRAWIGHAATALAIGCPEDITRKAWGMLTDEQRFLANQQADRAIKWWYKHRAKGAHLCKDVGEQVLF